MSSPSPDNDATPLELLLEIQRQMNANPRRSAAAGARGRITKNSTSPAKPAATKKKNTSKVPNRPVRHSEKSPQTTKKAEIGLIQNSPSSDDAPSGASSPFSDPPTDASLPFSDTSLEGLSEDVGFEPDSQSHKLTPRKRDSTVAKAPKTSIWRIATDITLETANARSVPAPGPQLRALVENARENLELAKQWHPDVVRYVDGEWMAPEMCDSCKELRNNKHTAPCDRNFPCSLCVRSGKACNKRTHMTKVKPPTPRLAGGSNVNKPRISSNASRKKQLSLEDQIHKDPKTQYLVALKVVQNKDGTWKTQKSVNVINASKELPKKSTSGRKQTNTRVSTHSSHEIQPLAAPHVFQRSDGTWQSKPQQPSSSNNTNRKRKAQSAATSLAIAPRPAKQRVKKRDFEDEDFEPVTDALADALIEDIVTRAPPRVKKTKRVRAYVPYHKPQQDHLPDPCGKPPVWAAKRQQLCETLPYYRAYMSGPYIHEGLVYGSLIDKEVGIRDVFGEEIIITRCGGGKVFDEATGRMIQASNQQTSTYGLGFQRAKDIGHPIAVIAGQGNSASPSKLPHYYNVLDWFHVTDVWAEMIDGFITSCVRMEKIRLDTKSWWAPIDSPPLDPNRNFNDFKTSENTCGRCHNVSKVIFKQGWTCLATKCEEFFVFDPPVDGNDLEYNDDFKNERTMYHGKPLGPLAPPFLTEADMIVSNRSGTEVAFTKGIVCPRCNGCSRRTEWVRWSCEYPDCGFTYSLPLKTISVTEARQNSGSHRADMYLPEFGITYEAKVLGAYNVFEYGVPGPDGRIVGVLRHFKSNSTINHQPDGPNDLFRMMQEKDFDLRRRPVRASGSTGEVLTNHFATNWGAPYKFVVAQSTRGFNEAPEVIMKALKRLTWAGEQTLTDVGEPFHPFNELLSIGYFEDCHIGYHDDGELTLGPTVATLSLGAQAVMSLRPKAKCQLGNKSHNQRGTKPDVLKVTLEHGDIVIMHGSGVQQYYEHEVVPDGKLRFALTCRYVRPEKMDNDSERAETAIKGALPEGHERYNYDGDVNAVLAPADFEKDRESERLNVAKRIANDLAVLCKSGMSKVNGEDLAHMREALGEFNKWLSLQPAEVIEQSNGEQTVLESGHLTEATAVQNDQMMPDAVIQSDHPTEATVLRSDQPRVEETVIQGE